MDFKKRLKAFLASILTFVMVFTASPLTSLADDIGAGDDVTGDAVYNVEWRFIVVDGQPLLRMHLVGGGHDVYGKYCRQANGNIYSRYASYKNMNDGNNSDTLESWLSRIGNSDQFSNTDFLRYSALDFYPTTVEFNRDCGCYAAWTAAIEGHTEIEDAYPGQIAVEIDLESFQKKGGFDVYCSYNDDGIDGDELWQSKRYSDTTWDNTENRFIGLPDPNPNPGDNYHWELIWASFSDQNWFNYSEIGAPTAVAWTDPNNHIDIANSGMALGGGTGVSPSDIPLTSEGFGAAICSSPTNKGLTGISERAF